jgi:hypothetical protein
MLVCVAIAAALPFPDIPLVTAKLDHFRRHANDYDTLFLGSSRIYHQLIPSLFDELTAEHGLKTKSFNAAIDGMRPPELNYYVDQLLAAHPRDLRWIFIENGALRITLDPQKQGTLREVYWHDFTRTCIVVRTALADRKPPRRARLLPILGSYVEPLRLISDHAALFVRNFVNLGRGSLLIEPLLLLPHSAFDLNAATLGPGGDGFRVTGREETILPEERRRLEEARAARRLKPFTIDYADDESQRAYEALLKRFEDLGAVTVQVIPPETGSRKFHLRSEAKTARIVLDYSDFDQYAALYAPENRIDNNHVNFAGAQLLTRFIADEFCARAPVHR